MAQACKACTHPNGSEIDARLADGVAASWISRTYGISQAAVHRHLHNHLTHVAATRVTTADVVADDDLLADARAALGAAPATLTQAISVGDSRTTRNQEKVLLLLADGPQASVSHLARRLGLSIPNATDIVSRLRRRSWVVAESEETALGRLRIRLVDPGWAEVRQIVATDSSMGGAPQFPRVGHSRRRLQEDFFAAGVTVENGYDFGFLLADGNVNRARNLLSIQLSRRDVAVLEGMRERLGSDAPIGDKTTTLKGKEYQQVSIGFSSARLCNDLYILGLGPNKDFEDQAYPLPLVSGPAAAAVVRGVFDGDGTAVRVLTRRPPGAKIVIYNRPATLDWLAEMIRRECQVDGTIYAAANRNQFQFTVIAHADVVRLTNWMYSTPGACLERKREKLFGLIAVREEGLAAKAVATGARDRLIAERYRAGMEMVEVAATTGISLGVVAKTVRQLGLHHRKPYKTPTMADLLDVRNLAANGASVKAIASETGFSAATVLKLLNDPVAATKLLAKATRDTSILELHDRGAQQREIATQLGVSVDLVHKVVSGASGESCSFVDA